MCVCGSAQRVSPNQRAECPVSGTIGKAVELLTVRALLTESALRRVTDSLHRFCPDPACDVVYFIDSGETASYRDVQAMVNRVACGLHRLGVRKGTRVAMMVPNIAPFPVTWLAIGRLGAVMVPVNISYTGRELDYIVNDGTWRICTPEFCQGCLEHLSKQHALVQDPEPKQ